DGAQRPGAFRGERQPAQGRGHQRRADRGTARARSRRLPRGARVIWPIIGPRLHGWLDDIVVALYVAGAWLLNLSGRALAIAMAGAAVHFLLARFTNYPQGTF